jgi:hypothetical protein
MNEEMIYNRLTKKEKELIDSIKKKAEKRRKKKRYDVKFIVDYMLESFKDFNYDERGDMIEMLDSILTVAKKCGIYTDKQIEEERKYIIKEYIDNE